MVCVDCTWFLPNSPFSREELANREYHVNGHSDVWDAYDARKWFEIKRIPSSVFCDLDELCEVGRTSGMGPGEYAENYE